MSYELIFMDGLGVDYMVQSKILEAGEQADDAVSQIKKILDDVNMQMNREV